MARNWRRLLLAKTLALSSLVMIGCNPGALEGLTGGKPLTLEVYKLRTTEVFQNLEKDANEKNSTLPSSDVSKAKTNFQQVAKIFETAANEFNSLKPPTGLEKKHETIRGYLEGAKNLYNEVGSFPDDPGEFSKQLKVQQVKISQLAKDSEDALTFLSIGGIDFNKLNDFNFAVVIAPDLSGCWKSTLATGESGEITFTKTDEHNYVGDYHSIEITNNAQVILTYIPPSPGTPAYNNRFQGKILNTDLIEITGCTTDSELPCERESGFPITLKQTSKQACPIIPQLAQAEPAHSPSKEPTEAAKVIESSPSPVPTITPTPTDTASDKELKNVINSLLDVSNREDIEGYANILDENSPNYSTQLESTRQNFEATNWKYEILEITVTEKFETEAKVFAKLRVTDLDSGGSDRAEVLYTLHKSGSNWKIFAFENKSFGV